MYNLNYAPSTLGVQSWRENICGGTRTQRVEYQCPRRVQSSATALCAPAQLHVHDLLLHVLVAKLWLFEGSPSSNLCVAAWVSKRVFQARSQNRLLASSCLSPHGASRLPLDRFWWNLVFELFRKSVEKIKVFLNPTRITSTLHEDVFTFMTVSRWILLRTRNVPNKSCGATQNTHFVCSNFFAENHGIYEIMSKNMVLPERLQLTMWRMRVGCWISKSTRHVLTRAHARTHLLLFDGSNPFVNAPECYLISTMCVFFVLCSVMGCGV